MHRPSIRRKLWAALATLAAAALAAGVPGLSAAQGIETNAKQAILIEDATDTILLEKDSHAPTPPASMAKLMTVYLIFERLASGSLSLDDTMAVSEKAWRMGGSKMFVRVNTRVRVEDLIRGIIVQSGNDACIVVAEALAGSEEAFAREMTTRGLELGLENSVFKNATGWPDPEQHVTARDIAVLSQRIIRDFPQFYHYFAEKNFTYNDIRQGNRNPLLYKDIGADGLKTGHTEESGYGLAASAIRNGRRLILVVNGLESVNQRSREAERILDWGYREFESYALFEAGEPVEEALVWLGDSPRVPLLLEDGLTVTIPRKARRGMTVTVVYDGPVPAPIAKGTPVANLVVSAPGIDAVQRPLVAGEDVAQLGVFGRLSAALSFLLWGAAGE